MFNDVFMLIFIKSCQYVDTFLGGLFDRWPCQLYDKLNVSIIRSVAPDIMARIMPAWNKA